MILATNNKGKLIEIQKILKGYEVKSLKEAGIDIDVDEDGETFYANALKKARDIYSLTGEPCIADDSGLCVCALGDWPGVLTHRFLGKDASDAERNNKIIERVNKEDNLKREAKVVCCLVYFDGRNTISATGEICGKISKSERGDNGFGFDPIFELDNGKTLAELSGEEKNLISARALACEKLLIELNKL